MDIQSNWGAHNKEKGNGKRQPRPVAKTGQRLDNLFSPLLSPTVSSSPDPHDEAIIAVNSIISQVAVQRSLGTRLMVKEYQSGNLLFIICSGRYDSLYMCTYSSFHGGEQYLMLGCRRDKGSYKVVVKC